MIQLAPSHEKSRSMSVDMIAGEGEIILFESDRSSVGRVIAALGCVWLWTRGTCAYIALRMNSSAD